MRFLRLVPHRVRIEPIRSTLTAAAVATGSACRAPKDAGRQRAR